MVVLRDFPQHCSGDHAILGMEPEPLACKACISALCTHPPPNPKYVFLADILCSYLVKIKILQYVPPVFSMSGLIYDKLNAP